VTDRELMQQALNVLKIFVDGGNSAWARKIIEIKEALRDRLAQPEEPDWSAAGFSKPPKQRDRQCPSCGGFCKETGCERENVQPEQRSEKWWRHEVSNAWAAGYEKGRASVKQSEQEPVAWIKERELLYMQAVAAHGKTDWKTNLGLKPEDDDVPLYTAPPQREDREAIALLVKKMGMEGYGTLAIAAAIRKGEM